MATGRREHVVTRSVNDVRHLLYQYFEKTTAEQRSHQARGTARPAWRHMVRWYATVARSGALDAMVARLWVTASDRLRCECGRGMLLHDAGTPAAAAAAASGRHRQLAMSSLLADVVVSV